MNLNIPKTCLVTGGCGFLGSNIASHFLKLGSKVVVIDALFRTGGQSNLDWLRGHKGNFEFIHGDLANSEIVNQAFKVHGPFDYVCHLGGQVAMTTSLADPHRDLLTNIVGTFNILEAIRLLSPNSFLAYSSTNKVYGDLLNLQYKENIKRYTVETHPSGFDESLSLDFASPYGCSKGSADQYVRDWNRNYGLKTTVFRHSSIYGGRQFSTFDQGWIGWFCRNALNQKLQIESNQDIDYFTIAGTGKQVRDVLHASDLIDLYHRAFHFQSECSGSIFNIGGGIDNSLSLLELFDLLQDLLKLPQPLAYTNLPPRKSDQLFFVADITKAKKVLGWKPNTSSREGITKMLDWLDSIDKSQV